MNTPNFVLYGLNQLGPENIGGNLGYMKESGFTTIIIGMLHIGNPKVKSTTQLGDIIFNGDEPLVIRDKEPPFPLAKGEMKANCLAWPGRIAALKEKPSTVTQVFASVGGGGIDIHGNALVRDFETIQSIYKENGYKFENSVLERNFTAFKKAFPAIDGIDMDCEETYDHDSFVAFCEMLIKIGFDITFCPYASQAFWVKALVALEQVQKMRYVKWWNLQCYDGGGGNHPEDWAKAIGEAFNNRPPAEDYIVAGDWVKFWDADRNSWRGNCPEDMTKTFSGFSKPSLAGGFIWDLDLIRASQKGANDRGNGCDGKVPISAIDYLAAMKKGLGL